jgi:hypothetical protein
MENLEYSSYPLQFIEASVGLPEQNWAGYSTSLMSDAVGAPRG